jgi:hypothetical protein
VLKQQSSFTGTSGAGEHVDTCWITHGTPDHRKLKYRKLRFRFYELAEVEVYVTDIRPRTPITTRYVDLSYDGILTVRPGFQWNGASGPTFHTANTFTASLIHDALCWLIENRWRERADKILYEILISRGMWKIRADLWYKAVRKAAEETSEHEVLTAP